MIWLLACLTVADVLQDRCDQYCIDHGHDQGRIEDKYCVCGERIPLEIREKRIPNTESALIPEPSSE